MVVVHRQVDISHTVGERLNVDYPSPQIGESNGMTSMPAVTPGNTSRLLYTTSSKLKFIQKIRQISTDLDRVTNIETLVKQSMKLK